MKDPAGSWSDDEEAELMLRHHFHFDGWSKTDFYTINPNLEHINRVKYLSRRKFSPKTAKNRNSFLLKYLLRIKIR